MAKPQGKKLSIPREMKDIQAEYQQLMLQAGQLQYQASVIKNEIDSINARAVLINNEGAARQQLDKAAPPMPETPTEPTKE